MFKIFRTNDKSSLVAIKVIDKYKLQDDIDQLMSEINILNRIDHPNIVNYFETYDDKRYIYLVMEYVRGKEMFEKITASKNSRFTEKTAAKYMLELFKAINHCHA